MTEIYLTERSITLLVQFILSLVITIYLFSIPQKTRPTWYLAGFFAGIATIGFFSLLDSIWRGVPQYYATQFQFVGIFIGLAALIQFAYSFPQPFTHQGREYKLISFLYVISVILFILNFFYAIYIFEYFGILSTYSISYVQIIIVEFLWTIFVLLRRTVHLSTHQGPWWQALIRPQGKAAKASLYFSLMFSLPLLSSVVVLLENSIISLAQGAIIRTVSVMVMFLGLVIVYLNYTFERTTIMVKLVAISLTTILSVLGVIGILIAPLLSQDYSDKALPMQQGLHFEPSDAGFTISEKPFRFDSHFGQALTLEDDDSQVVPLPFAFPFYEQHWTEMYINSDGAVSFGHEMVQAYFGFDDFRQAAILVMLVDLNPMANGQVFFKSEADRVVVTWDQVGEFDFPSNLNTFQLVLYKSGAFDMSYDTLTLESPYKPFGHHESHAIGVLPGINQPPQFIDMTSDLPVIEQGAQGVIEDYQLSYRRYLHQYYTPLFYVILGGSLLIIFGFPVFFHTNLIQPLKALVEGVKEVNDGQLEVSIPAMYSDEIGFLTTSFNNMVRSIKQGKKALEEINADLEKRVFERTKQLSESNEKILLAKEEAEEAQYTAEAANQAKSTFLANMSHELRTPLNAILGFGQLMTRSQTLSRENQEYIGIISRSGEHLLTLINNVLNLSKIEAGRTTLNETNFDLYRLLDQLEEMFQLRADDKRLQLLFELADDVPQYIHADEVKLRQILINLLNNALKFTAEGGLSVRVKACAEERSKIGGQRLYFEVQDTGAGIAPEELDSLFEAFVQTEAGRQAQEGTGLGLPISRQFVQLMGGELGVQSEIGHGTTFHFEIQVRIVQEDDIKEKQAKRRVIALEPNQPRYRILIVDDKYNNRRLLLKLLSPLGFEVREAENGQKATELWQAWKPHLIWMDMRMPIMDGYEATKRIKASTKGQATAIIALTASTYEEERAVVLSAGCDDFMRKPFREAELFEMMHKHLGVRYVYEEQESLPTEPTQEEALSTEGVPELAEGLAALPADLLTRLEEAADEGNMLLIDELIDESRQHNAAVAAQLAALAEDFEYGEILTLLQEAKGGERRPSFTSY